MHFAFVFICSPQIGMLKKKVLVVETFGWLGSMSRNIVCGLVYLCLDICFKIKKKKQVSLTGTETY